MRHRNLWYWSTAAGIPLLLIGLFEVLKGQRGVMDRWVFGVMAPVEQALGRFWAVIPGVSIAEVMTALTLTGGIVWLCWVVIRSIRGRSWGSLLRGTAAFLAAVLWLGAGFCWMWNGAYYASTFAQRSGLVVQPYSVERLAEVTAWFAQQAAHYSTQVPRDGSGQFAVEREEIFRRGVGIYEELSKEFPCLELETSTRAKPIFFSRIQSRLGFTGVYFPFTGEANVNVDAPMCLLPVTIAHEMAHQRMVAAEQEANFVGIAAAVSSKDPIYVYSGYLMGLIQLSNALSPVAPEAWRAIVQQYFTKELTLDWDSNNAYWAALSSPVEEAAEQAYDSFLKGNGQELGIQSYGACVDLLVTYFQV